MLKSKLPETTNGNEIDSESEDETEFGVRTLKPKHPMLVMFATKKTMYCIMFAVIVAICMVMAVTFWPKNSAQPTDIEQESFDTLQHLMKDGSFNISNDENNDESYNAFDTAFATFDVNNDGYLDETEFSHYFVMQLNYSNTFEVMDANNDNILSYPEAVIYEQKLNEIAPIKQNTLATMVEVIWAKYGFQYSNTSAASFDILLEFVVILEYFEVFDSDKSGFITRDEFLRIGAKQEFEAYASDKNGKISHDAFFDVLYGNDKNSWKGQLTNMFGESYQETMNKIAAINISPEMVKNVQITVSPIKTLRAVQKYDTKRRLGWCDRQEFRCSWTYDAMGNSVYRCEYVCVW